MAGRPHQWGVIGISRDQWALLAAALALGGNVRVGLEDNFYLPDGEMARSNGDLVAQARADGDRRRPAVGDGRRGARSRLGASRGAASSEAAAMSGLPPRRASRVLDLSRLLPGGFCSLLLADFGADVLKVEDTGFGRLRALGAAARRGRPRTRASSARSSHSTAANARSGSI